MFIVPGSQNDNPTEKQTGESSLAEVMAWGLALHHQARQVGFQTVLPSVYNVLLYDGKPIFFDAALSE